MNLNDISPASGSRKTKRRVGRGAGSGWGKTAARGQKGQKARSGGGVKPGFEGGQMPMQRRVPKFGFRSRIGIITAEVRLSELAKVKGDEVSIETLQAANVISRGIKRVRIILSGEVSRAVTIKSNDGAIKVTKGATAAITTAGGTVL